MNLFGQDYPLGIKPGRKPDFPPSYQVHIHPTKLMENGTADSSGPDYWSAAGYDLRTIIAKVYEVASNRIDLPASLEDNARYDFAMVLPRVTSEKEINHLVRQGISEHFGVTTRFETRLEDVYVLTAPIGQTPAMQTSPDGFAQSSVTFAVKSPDGKTFRPEELEKIDEDILHSVKSGSTGGTSSIEQISMSHGTIAEFCQTLELGLDRLVVDETNLQGTYDFLTHGEPKSTEEFFAILRDQLGLTLSGGQRGINYLVVRRK